MSHRFVLPVFLFLVAAIGFATSTAVAQQQQQAEPNAEADSTFNGFRLRAIGPAFMSGRIADIAIHPEDPNIWYVAVGSGGVWKTVNAGTTWEPIFDDQSSYSIGCVTIDPVNPHTVWVGTGEDVGGRHVGFGDGVYRSDDGGGSWTNMGLVASEHVSRILIHPDDSDVIWVAAQGPLWRSGGDRGLYKSLDGGATWIKTLGDDAWVGVTDIVMDPRDPDRLYAATWQRHRTVSAYMGGGPGSGIHVSEDGGETWRELTKGLPQSNLGKIGLAVSPQQPDILYAAIEEDRRMGGVYRSADRGETWKKMSSTVSGGTGPHYYQELYASPHQFERLYLMDWNMRISNDGGATFKGMNERYKHGDNHAIAFRPDDPDYLLVGSDGGLYESFDLTETWRYVANLPVTQFYKVALDDSEPFYNVYGGTQDNGTQGGPSRTDYIHGIQNSDWRLVLGWDGHQPATEPGNPAIVYGERQEGRLARLDMTTGEVMDIQPQPGADEGRERFNWDAPILVSPHQPSRIYFASHRVWQSDNRGDAWRAISGDLTRNEERLTLPIMGRVQSWDNAWDVAAMSTYNTITSLAESPLQEGLIYAGTDDGLIQVTEDGGATWRSTEVGSLPGVPARAFVNDIKADLFDADVAYAALDDHKSGNFSPYLYKTEDRGRTWRSIAGNLPRRNLVWRVVQDHVKSDLLFAATEFGLFVTLDGGTTWRELHGGVPMISFRDLAIQRREDDLVGASFGRGFFILDDYSALREVSDNLLDEEATLFKPRDARWYIPRSHLDFDEKKGSQGDAHFVAPNPPFGAVFTYYLKDDSLKTLKSLRREREKELDAAANVPFPGWDALEAEVRQEEPGVWMTVSDGDGNVVRRIKAPVKRGFNRVAWDLRHPAPNAVSLPDEPGKEPGSSEPVGMLVAPGTYTVTLSKEVDGVVTTLSGPQSFEVVPMKDGALEGAPHAEAAAFWMRLSDANRRASALSTALSTERKRVSAMETALKRTPAAAGELDARLHDAKVALLELDMMLNGPAAKREIGENYPLTVGGRLFTIGLSVETSTYGPTQTNRQSLDVAESQMSDIQTRLETARSSLAQLEADLLAAGAPYIEGGELPE